MGLMSSVFVQIQMVALSLKLKIPVTSILENPAKQISLNFEPDFYRTVWMEESYLKTCPLVIP